MAATFLVCLFLSDSTQALAQPPLTQPQSLLAFAPSTGDDSAATAPDLPDASSDASPDAPSPALPQQPSPPAAAKRSAPAESDEGRQTKRILGIVPNFRSVSVNTKLPAQTPAEKFIGFAQDSFDYSSFIFIGLLSGVSQLEGSTPEFHTGPPAYARYYWHNYADQTDENLWVGFLIPVALHQDARFYTLGSGAAGKHNGLAKRAGYAFSRILVTHTDSGGSYFNVSEVVGSGAASGISNLYYPSSNRTWTKTGQRWALNVGIDGATFIFKEFWPDINHALFHSR
jgi:hypothetical protein